MKGDNAEALYGRLYAALHTTQAGKRKAIKL